MIYKINDTIEQLSEQDVAELLLLLPDWRREQALRFKHLSGQRECAVSYLLLCQMLSKEYGISQQPHFIIGTHGKPSLHEFPHIHFSISHCREAVMCAVSSHPIGADIERRRTLKPALINHTMNENERVQIQQSSDPELEFTKLWTAKEAVVKLSGEGLSHNITDILDVASDNNIIIETSVNKENTYAYSLAYTNL